MRAVEYAGAGGPEVLSVVARERPEPARGQVLIEVVAAGLNRADVAQREGAYPPPAGASDIPGLEVSGRVIACGDGSEAAVQELVGTDVVALLAGGGYAEYVAVDARHTLPVPAGIDVLDAAGLIEVAATVHSNLRGEAGLTPDDNLLIHGGAGGIGTFAVQFVRAFRQRSGSGANADRPAQTIVTVGSQAKAEFALSCGATEAIDYSAEDFSARVREITDGAGVDVLLDVVGAKYLEKNLGSLSRDGRMVVIGLQGGRKAELDMGLMLGRRLRIIATTLRARDAERKAEIVRGVADEVWPLIESVAIVTHTDAVFDLDQAREAHEHFDAGSHTGKVLLRMR